MSNAAVVPEVSPKSSLVHDKLNKSPGKLGIVLFALILLGGVGFIASRLLSDLSVVHSVSAWPYILLGIALFVALGFEFVNGFHDTANAVATVIYTHSLEPHVAVVWSGMWNFIGVLTSSGAVAFAIVSLLPVELILQVGSGAGFAMVFALLIAAILWNLGTWWLGIPASSSHTMVGSIIGVGLANQLLSVKSGTSGVDWGQAVNIFRTLLISPLVGFGAAAILLLVLKVFVKDKRLYEAPTSDAPPPFWIRCLLILTCTGVSFGHGSNDGQKGMGLIMLILIGTVPTAYALNHAVGGGELQTFVAVSEQAVHSLQHYVDATPYLGDPRPDVTAYIAQRQMGALTIPATAKLATEIEQEVSQYRSLASVPSSQQGNIRNDMYLVSEAIRIMQKQKSPNFNSADAAAMKNYKTYLDKSTKFIPTWVKVAVALALGMGTMIGWKRIVVTVGEKIGKDHLTYAQGASAEIVTMCTIIAADRFGMPVSTTHVLSSGVAGTMAANHSGLQWSTIRSIAMAWVCTLPAAAVISGLLFWLFRQFV